MNNNPNKSKRDATIELYRIMLMFLICLLHSFSFGIASNKYWISGLMWAVCGFVFISGWFGIRFSVSKLLRLFCLGLICGSIALFVAWLVGLEVEAKDMSEILCRQWFLCAYMMLMLFAPMINLAFDSIKTNPNVGGGGVGVALILVITWNWLGNAKPWYSYGPYTPGMGSYTFLMMITVYCIGRFARIACDNHQHTIFSISRKRLIALCIVNIGVLLFGWRLRLGSYCSPSAMSMAALAFFVFRDIRLQKWLGKLVMFVAPSMFSVYLLHSHLVGATIIKAFQNRLVSGGLSKWFSIAICALSVFVGCIVIDLVRRLVAGMMYSPVSKILKRIDCLEEKIANRIEIALKHV